MGAKYLNFKANDFKYYTNSLLIYATVKILIINKTSNNKNGLLLSSFPPFSIKIKRN